MLTEQHVGKSFTCFIKGNEVEGQIQFENGNFYLCQNVIAGMECTDKLGYNSSWFIGTGQKYHLDFEGVTEFFIGKKVHFSKSFIEFLTKTQEKSKISDILLNNKTLLTAQEINYITNRNDMISYLPADKKHVQNQDGTWRRDGRQEGKPSKTVRKLLTQEALDQLTDKDFESFANIYKSISDFAGTFRIVSGKEIAEWYPERTYAEGQGSLNSSCMRDKQENVFELYVKNTSVVSMLILVDKNNKLLGRALLWNALEGKSPIKVMDRIYGNDSTFEIFKAWAEDNGYIYRQKQAQDMKEYFVKGGENVTISLTVQLDVARFNSYPYLDTFTYLRMDKGIIMNKSGNHNAKMSGTGGALADNNASRRYGFNRPGFLYYNGEDSTDDPDENHEVCAKDGEIYPLREMREFNGLYYHNKYFVELETGGSYLIDHTFICAWSGKRYYRDQGIRLITGEVVYKGHSSLFRLGTIVDHIDNFFTCSYSKSKEHKMHRTILTVDGVDYPVHKDSVQYLKNRIERLNAKKVKADA